MGAPRLLRKFVKAKGPQTLIGGVSDLPVSLCAPVAGDPPLGPFTTKRGELGGKRGERRSMAFSKAPQREGGGGGGCTQPAMPGDWGGVHGPGYMRLTAAKWVRMGTGVPVLSAKDDQPIAQPTERRRRGAGSGSRETRPATPAAGQRPGSMNRVLWGLRPD